MWFRRKRRSDPDSALTETLRSLQTLLDDETPVERRLQPGLKMPRSTPEPSAGAGTVETPPAGRKPLDEATAAAPRSGVQSMENDTAADLEEERTKPEPAGQELLPTKAPLTVDWDDSPEIPEIEAPAIATEGMDRPEHRPPDADRVSDTDTVDSIPVLTEVVYEPPQGTTVDMTAEKESRERREIIDSLVAGLARRLEQYGRRPMDTRQEQRLREFLSSILAH